MERWGSEMTESQPPRMNRRTVWPLAVARRGSWHPHLSHTGAKMEGTIWRELTSRDSDLAEDSASSGGQSALNSAFFLATAITVSCTTSSASVSASPALTATL